jgi:hypothetical protein
LPKIPLATPRRIAFAILTVSALAAAILIYRTDPAHGHIFPPCPLRALTGLYCPGCGSLRALHQLLHGNLHCALALNPLMVISIPFLILFILRPKTSQKKWLPATVLIILITYTLLRNIPCAPFSILTPH